MNSGSFADFYKGGGKRNVKVAAPNEQVAFLHPDHHQISMYGTKEQFEQLAVSELIFNVALFLNMIRE